MAVDIFPTSPNEPLELSEERYTSAAGEVKHEHYHRYFFALQFCDKKEVLDVASGEGYGTALLGIVAQRVLGVDLSPEAVTRASRNYRSQRVSFTVCDYAAMPVSDASMDVVVSFEALEHVADQQKFFCEIKRILRPDGLLVISTPNAKVYKDLATALDPSQVKELDAGKFWAIVSEHFSNCRLLGQRSVIGSAIVPDPSSPSGSDRHQTFRAEDSGVYSVQEGIGRPSHFIAVASETALSEIRHGLLDDQPFLKDLYNLLEKRAIGIRETAKLLRATITNRDALHHQLRSRESELSEVHTRLSQLSSELQSRDDELARSRALVAAIHSSGSWRVTFPLRFLRQIIVAIRRRGVRLADRLGVGRLLARLPLPRKAVGRSDEAAPQAAATGSETELQILQRSGLFDERFYCEFNPDVVASEITPLVHFSRFGAQEGRFPRRECYERDLQRLGRLAAARYRQDKLEYRPLVSVLMGTYNTQPIYLEAAVRSVIAQAYSNWELRIVDDGSSNSATLDTLARVAAWDTRILVVQNANHSGISQASNYALNDAHGEYVAMLDENDELIFDALYEIVLVLNTDRAIDAVYTDEDYVSPAGETTTHLFKPDWSPSLFRGVMYVGQLLVVRRSLALDAGGFESDFDAVRDYEFMLRISERTRKIRHVPKVLYRSSRNPVSVTHGEKANGGVEQLQAAAVQGHLRRLGLDGSARPNPHHSGRVIIKPVGRPLDATFDLIVHSGGMPVAGAGSISSALARTAHRPARIVVPAASSGAEIVANIDVDLLFDDAHRHASEAERLSIFLSESSADFVLAMSADVAIGTDSWLELLLAVMQERDVAMVCPAVLSADGFIAHAGLIVGSDASVRPAMHGLEPEGDGYAGSLSCAREISAAWADVALLRRSAIASLLPPRPAVYITADFLVADLTLRATRAGLRALCVPYVSARQPARAEVDEARRLDALLFQDLWAGKAVVDPFYNQNFIEQMNLPKTEVKR